MTVATSPELRAAYLDGSHSSRYVADVYYDGRLTYPNLPIAFAGSITATATGRVQTSGRIYVTSDARIGDRTLAPQAMLDILAPFGQEIDVRLEISVGGTVIGAVSIGRFRITEVPDSRETARRLNKYDPAIREAVTLELVVQDMLESIDADDFERITSPQWGTSWAEFRHLSPIPIIQSLPDRSLPTDLIYPSLSRLDALALVARNLGGVLHVTRQGYLTVRPNDPLAAGVTPVDLSGTIQEMSNSLSNDLRNKIIVTGSVDSKQQTLAIAEIAKGPLSVYGPLRRRTKQLAANLNEVAAFAQRTADTALVTESSAQTKVVRLTLLPHPEVEIGDPAIATDPETDRVETGIVTRLEFSMDPTALMSADITIPRLEIPWA